MSSASAGIDARRICETPDCGTVLSKHNSRPVCASCEARVEIGGASIPLPRQPSYPSRPPAPERPTTEGAVPLPGRVVVRERSYAEMIAKPADSQDKPVAAACAECGAPLPKDHKGWLCRLCAIAAEQPAEEDTTSLETPQAPTPSAPAASSKADSKAPGNLSQKRTGPQKGAHNERSSATGAGPMRRLPADVLEQIKAPRLAPPTARGSLDWPAVCELFERTGNLSAVARHFGVKHTSIRHAVDATLGPERVDQIIQLANSDALCRIAGCTNPPRPQSLTGSRKSRWFRICDAHHQAQLEKNRQRTKTHREHTCKRPGCFAAPAHRSGRYAMLCNLHARDARADHQRACLASDITCLERFIGRIADDIAHLSTDVRS